MMDVHYNHCAKCGFPDHHFIECTVGEIPIQFSVLRLEDKFQEKSNSTVAREDASIEGDLVNLDEDNELFEHQPSQTSYQNALQDLMIEPVIATLSYELSPTTPNYDARFQEDIEKAIRRSLVDKEKETYNIAAKDTSVAMYQQQESSDNQDVGHAASEQEDEHENVENTGVGSTAASKGVEENQESSIGPRKWETTTTPKALKDRELVPRSSLLAFQGTTPPGKDRGRDKDQKRTAIEPITRTFNSETNTMTVNSIRQKRRDRRSQRVYYDITPELQYLR